ncbi:hypothetical protein IQ07DRAFT_670568 [Pyrenochaeta sp. DS3sAY3a]|nr:hypothetical protein IQ07DRAFT_670568 [Pyrenochaeta sp. DS3sAY3a]
MAVHELSCKSRGKSYETLRRIERRRASRAVLMASSRSATQAGRPILRRGPQRSVREALTEPTIIPILRSRPQQAILASTDDDSEDDERFPGRPRMDSVAESTQSSPPQAQRPTSSRTPSSPLRISQLTLDTQQNSLADGLLSTPYEHTSDPPSSPAVDVNGHVISESTETAGVEMSARHGQSSPTHSDGTSAELRGGGRNIAVRNARHVASPLHQMHTLSPPTKSSPCKGDTDGPGQLKDKPANTLKGHFKDSSNLPIRLRYHYDERMPQTEPRRPSARQPVHSRSLSSGNAPSFSLLVPLSGQPVTSTDNVFDTPTSQPDPHVVRDSLSISYGNDSLSSLPSGLLSPGAFPQLEPTIGRSRHFSSEASDGSAAFSYYGSELLGSRHSSSQRSGQSQHQNKMHSPSGDKPEGQYDEDPISDVAFLEDSAQSPPTHVDSSQPLLSSTQHGVSPLPSVPYNRSQWIQNPLESSINFANGQDASVPSLDAAFAAVQDLRSPLDDYSDQYHRLARAFNARQSSASRSSSPVQPSESYHTNRSRRTPVNQAAQNPRGPRVATTARTQQPVPLQAHGSSEHADDVFPHIPHRNVRSSSSYPIRTSQRSSENAHISTTTTTNEVIPGNVQVQRAAYEQLQSAVQAMQTLSSRLTASPSHRSTLHPNPARHTTRESLANPHHRRANRSSQTYRTASSSSPARLPAEQPLSQHHQLPPHPPHSLHSSSPRLPIPHTRAPPRPVPFLPSTRPLVRTATATAPARTRPRVPPRLRDQENSGDAEMQGLREELAGRERMGEGAERGVMDDTPPRVGRVERWVGTYGHAVSTSAT